MHFSVLQDFFMEHVLFDRVAETFIGFGRGASDHLKRRSLKFAKHFNATLSLLKE